MLNGHDVLAKGELLNKQGVRLDLLEASSVAFSMSKAPREAKVAGGCEQELGEPPPGPTCTPKRCRKILVGRLESLHSLHESIALRHYRRKHSHQARRSWQRPASTQGGDG